MESYCINRNGNHEVHLLEKCEIAPSPFNRVQFYAESTEKALAYARQFYPESDVCDKCFSEN